VKRAYTYIPGACSSNNNNNNNIKNGMIYLHIYVVLCNDNDVRDVSIT